MDPGTSHRRPPTNSTADLLLRCRRGDQHAWERLIVRYERLVFSIPLNYGLGREHAADVMQTTFAELLANLDGIRESDSIGAWLATVARRLTWRAIAAAKRESEEISRRASESVGSGRGHDAIDAWTDRNWAMEGLLSLDEPCQKLLALLFLDPAQPSYDEISALLEVPRGSIGPQRARCLEKLRTALHALDEHV